MRNLPAEDNNPSQHHGRQEKERRSHERTEAEKRFDAAH